MTEFHVFIYSLLYFLGAVATGLCVYILLIKKYLKENTALKFNIWIENYGFSIAISALFWFIILPIGIIAYIISKIIERINKHYNVKL